jgi:hypothetical protein
LRSSLSVDGSSIAGGFVIFSTTVVDMPARRRAQALWSGAPLMGSGNLYGEKS